MRTGRRAALGAGIAFGAGLLVHARAAHARAAVPLFRITRSKNANVVQYDAMLKSAAELDPREPVVCYWLELAEDGRREPLRGLEHRAYGFKVAPERGGSWLLYLNAARDRAVRVVHWQGRWVAQVVIAGRSAVLTRIFVASDESGLIPSVRWIDLFGVDMVTGKPSTERVKP